MVFNKIGSTAISKRIRMSSIYTNLVGGKNKLGWFVRPGRVGWSHTGHRPTGTVGRKSQRFLFRRMLAFFNYLRMLVRR